MPDGHGHIAASGFVLNGHILSCGGAAYAVEAVTDAFEIYRWHHMTPPLRLNAPAPPPGFPPPQPGLFLLATRATARAAPPAFLLLALAVGIARRHDRHGKTEGRPTP